MTPHKLNISYLCHWYTSISEFIDTTGQTKAVYGYSVLSQLIVFITFTELGKVDMLERSNSESYVLGCDRCRAYERRGFFSGI